MKNIKLNPMKVNEKYKIKYNESKWKDIKLKPMKVNEKIYN